MEYRTSLLLFALFCSYVNAQYISSFKTTKTKKIKLPNCGCQNQVEAQNYGSGVPVFEPALSCGCIDTCACQIPYLNNLELPFIASFASSIPFEAFSYVLPDISQYSHIPLAQIPSSAVDLPFCGCQSPNCECNLLNCGYQSPNYGYHSSNCGCQLPNCGCRLSNCGCRSPSCGCQLPNCGCQLSNCGCQMSNCGCRSANCECQLPSCKCQSLNCGCQQQDCSCRKNCGCQRNCGCPNQNCDCPLGKCECIIPDYDAQSLSCLNCARGLSACGCQNMNYGNQGPICSCQNNPCTCQSLQIPNIFDLLTSLEVPYSQAIYNAPYDVTSYYGLSTPKCTCQVQNCCCETVPLTANLYDSLIFSIFGFNNDVSPCSCGCHYYIDSPKCECQYPKCNCQLANCCCQNGICSCGLDYGCGCGKYLRQVLLPPPFSL